MCVACSLVMDIVLGLIDKFKQKLLVNYISLNQLKKGIKVVLCVIRIHFNTNIILSYYSILKYF